MLVKIACRSRSAESTWFLSGREQSTTCKGSFRPNFAW